MLKELKSPQKDSNAWCSDSDRLQMAEDTLSAVRRVRKDVVECMRVLMKQGKERRSDGMFALVETMLRKTKCLCSLLDQAMVEEAFAFLEDNRLTQRPEKDEFSESVAEFMQRNKLKIDLPPLFRPAGAAGAAGAAGGGVGGAPGMNSLQTPCSEFLSKELRTPEVSASAAFGSDGDFWRTYSAYTSGYQSVDRLSDIDEFEESFKYLSVIDKTKHYYTLCRTGSPIDTPVATPQLTPKRTQPQPNKEEDDGAKEETATNETSEENQEYDEGIEDAKEEDEAQEASQVEESQDEQPECTEPSPERAKEDSKESEEKKDQNLTSDSPNTDGLHYRNGDEPEPIDLTHLNVEAAMMCLASKVRVLCGKANSPTLCARTFRFKELDAARTTGNGTATMPKSASHDSSFKIPDVPRPTRPDGDSVSDWAAELRPSMRKLRQGMDSLCKTARLVCTVLRLRQLREAVNLTHSIKYRRDVCFSQALTSLVSSLMAKFWASAPDPAFVAVCTQLGPLACFESLLSMNGEDVTIFNDMIVAIEDLRNVEFSLIMVDNKRISQTAKRSHQVNVGRRRNSFMKQHLI